MSLDKGVHRDHGHEGHEAGLFAYSDKSPGLFMNWNKMVPELIVSDLARSLPFYTELLGFTLAFQRDAPPFAYLDYDSAQLMLEQLHEGGWITGALEPPLGRGVNFQIEVAAVQPILDRLQRAGVTLFREPRASWYAVGDHEEGQIEFLVQDPDGYLLRFCEILGERPL
jgi:catechol 2,3-dioxygenase-like lactoylglutathione lyase family enzyme